MREVDPSSRAAIEAQVRQQLPEHTDLTTGSYSADNFLHFDLPAAIDYIISGFDTSMEVIGPGQRQQVFTDDDPLRGKPTTVAAFVVVAEEYPDEPGVVYLTDISIWQRPFTNPEWTDEPDPT